MINRGATLYLICMLDRTTYAVTAGWGYTNYLTYSRYRQQTQGE